MGSMSGSLDGPAVESDMESIPKSRPSHNRPSGSGAERLATELSSSLWRFFPLFDPCPMDCRTSLGILPGNWRLCEGGLSKSTAALIWALAISSSAFLFASLYDYKISECIHRGMVNQEHTYRRLWPPQCAFGSFLQCYPISYKQL
jgi:hypothetical protein